MIRLFSGTVILCGLLATACAHRPPAESPHLSNGSPVLTLLTYNVNFGIPGDAETLAAIRDVAADVVLLQETNASWERAIRGSLSYEFPFMTFKHRAGAGGMAVLSRMEPERIDFLSPTKEHGGWFPAVCVVLNSDIGRVQLLGVHLRPAVSDGGSWVAGHFSTPAVRAAEIQSFFAHVAPDIPTVVAGDFNEEEDGDVARFLTERGFASALARFAPDQFTWRWPTAIGELHKQLDHVFYDGRLDALSAEIRAAGRSDHLPVVAVLVQRASRR